MSGKSAKSGDDTSRKKLRTHKLHTIETKMEIIKRSESGESLASIARLYDVNRSTICSIMKNKSKIKEYVRNCGNTASKILSTRHGVVMDKMEKSLSSWIDNQYQNNIPLTFSVIQAKALSLYEAWRVGLKDDSNKVFRASNGWFHKFKIRYSLQNIKFNGELVDMDKDAAKQLISASPEIAAQEEYSSQISNTHNVGLILRNLPHYVLSTEELVAHEHGASESQPVSPGEVQFCGIKPKPLLTYKAKSYRASKREDEDEDEDEEWLPEGRKMGKNAEKETNKVVKNMTIKNMSKAFMHLNKFLTIMEECDPNRERISKVRGAIEQNISCYRHLYEEKRQRRNSQLTPDRLIKEASKSTYL